MIERDDAKPLAGIVQLDDAYWGGERHGGATGRGSPGKTPFVAAVQITAKGFPMAMRMGVVTVGRRQPDQPVGDPRILLARLALVTKARLADC